MSAAIRLKQLEKERGGDELRVVVLEKGSEVGTFITLFKLGLSANTMQDPIYYQELSLSQEL